MAIRKQGKVIAIDGPAGTGKSSAARRLADVLGFVHVDTGALYRAVALAAKRRGFSVKPQGTSWSPTEADELTELAKSLHLEFRREPKRMPSNRVLCNSEDVSDLIRTLEISMLASSVSSIGGVRSALLGLQRRLGCQGNSILEGRDIGTVVFPDADIKFFLEASVEERAKRRMIELEASGADAPSFEDLKRQIESRDLADRSRAVAPLRQAQDAIAVDTTALTLDEVVQALETTVRSKVKI